jgi:hypothetical protein
VERKKAQHLQKILPGRLRRPFPGNTMLNETRVMLQ